MLTEGRSYSGKPGHRTHDMLIADGYKLVEEAWDNLGRRTYQHDDDIDKASLRALLNLLRPLGWELDRHKLRAFRHADSGDEIELEPGGADTTGHFLHHMKRPQ